MLTSGSWRTTRVRNPEALGRALREARRRSGMTQSDLAERALATRQSIAALEVGHEARTLQILFDALAALGLELAVRPRGEG
jgi:HTH-type transcriptional regulator/antitoxin HipB